MKYLRTYNESINNYYKTKSVNVEFDKIKMSKFNRFKNLTFLDIVNDWDNVKNIDNPNIETIKYFVDNPQILKNECLIYDNKGLSDGYHRLIAMKILNFKKFNYKINSFNESINNVTYAYHVTSRKNLESIMKIGLEPRIPEDYGENGDIKGVYLFKTLDDTKNALYNWLGQRIEDIEEETGEEYDEVVLKVDISDLGEHLIDSVEYEWTCLVTIEPSRIIDVIKM